MKREEKFATLAKQVYLHLTFSGIYDKKTCTNDYKLAKEAIDKEVIFELDQNKLRLRLSSRSKKISLQSNTLKIEIQTEDIYLLNTVLKHPVIVEKMVEVLIKDEQNSQNLQTSLVFFEQYLEENLASSFDLNHTSDFEHELTYQSSSGCYSAVQSEKFIYEGLFTADKVKYTLYERHPKFEIFSIESNSNSEEMNTKILNIMNLIIKINYSKFSSISLNKMLGESLYSHSEVLQTTLRSKPLLEDFESYTGIKMSYIPQKNLGFYISSNYINQQQYQSLVIENSSMVQADNLEINNLTLDALQHFIDRLNQFENHLEYLIPTLKQIQWIESLVNSQWGDKKKYHNGLQLFDLSTSKAFWLRDIDLKVRKYIPFLGFDDHFSLEHTTCKLVAFPKK
ncbi:MAG: hypothetical protein KC646_04670 [Candidatus Cloacimonetes bacterium]|nr:hypothetical protein [Candidatus Cloacimonadota bacterium]